MLNTCPGGAVAHRPRQTAQLFEVYAQDSVLNTCPGGAVAHRPSQTAQTFEVYAQDSVLVSLLVVSEIEEGKICI